MPPVKCKVEVFTMETDRGELRAFRSWQVTPGLRGGRGALSAGAEVFEASINRKSEEARAKAWVHFVRGGRPR